MASVTGLWRAHLHVHCWAGMESSLPLVAQNFGKTDAHVTGVGILLKGPDCDGRCCDLCSEVTVSSSLADALS